MQSFAQGARAARSAQTAHHRDARRPSSTTSKARPTIGPTIQPMTRSQLRRSDRPPRLSQAKQIAQTRAPPSVSTQQSPHTGSRQRAHGPAAVAPQRAHRAGPPPPSCSARPVIAANVAPRRDESAYAGARHGNGSRERVRSHDQPQQGVPVSPLPQLVPARADLRAALHGPLQPHGGQDLAGRRS